MSIKQGPRSESTPYLVPRELIDQPMPAHLQALICYLYTRQSDADISFYDLLNHFSVPPITMSNWLIELKEHDLIGDEVHEMIMAPVRKALGLGGQP